VQCSVYVRATVSYLHAVGGKPLSRVDERSAPPAGGEGGRESPGAVRWLHRIHVLLYGWQDACAAWLDRRMLAALAARLGGENAGALVPYWRRDRRALGLLSVLGLGTQLAAMSLALLLGRPALYLALVIIAGNAYLALVQPLRARAAERAWRNRALPDQEGSLLREPPVA
jgi:hypothetical protein